MTQRIIYQNDYPYFVTTKTFYDRNIFNHKIYAIILHKNIVFRVKKYEVTLFAFCILPNHCHLLLGLERGELISKLMMQIKSNTAYDIHLWSQGKPCSVGVDGYRSQGKPCSVGEEYRPTTHTEHRLRCDQIDQIKRGPIWQPRYNFRIINTETRLINTLEYMRKNHVKHGYGKEFSRAPFLYRNLGNIERLF